MVPFMLGAIILGKDTDENMVLLHVTFMFIVKCCVGCDSWIYKQEHTTHFLFCSKNVYIIGHEALLRVIDVYWVIGKFKNTLLLTFAGKYGQNILTLLFFT